MPPEVTIEPFLDLAEHAVEKALEAGAKWAEARLQRDVSASILLRNGHVEALGFGELSGIGIRVLVDGSLAFASTDKLSKEAVELAVREAVKLARAFRGDVRLSEEKFVEDRVIVRPEQDAFEVPEDEKIEFLKSADKVAEDVFKRAGFQSTRTIDLTWSLREQFYVNSEGARILQVIPRISCWCYLVGVHGGVTETISFEVGNSGGWERTREWKLEEKVREHAEAVVRIVTEAKKCPEGRMDVVLGPSVAGLCAHECVGHPYEADRIWGREGAQAGESFVTPDMVGKQVANECVTVIDDPTIPGSFGYYLYDEEGVRARPRYLLKNGVITDLLHNRESAARFGTKSTAAARASAYNREPIPRMANTYFAPGDYSSLDELIEDIKLGVYIKSFGEWNIDDRRFNQIYVAKEAWLIENGRITTPVKYPVLEITTPAFYRAIDALTKHVEFEAATCGKGDPGQGVPVWTGAPHVRLRNIVIKVR